MVSNTAYYGCSVNMVSMGSQCCCSQWTFNQYGQYGENGQVVIVGHYGQSCTSVWSIELPTIVNQLVWFEWPISQCFFKMSMVSQCWSIWSISVSLIWSVGQYGWSMLLNIVSSVTYYYHSISWSV